MHALAPACCGHSKLPAARRTGKRNGASVEGVRNSEQTNIIYTYMCICTGAAMAKWCAQSMLAYDFDDVI